MCHNWMNPIYLCKGKSNQEGGHISALMAHWQYAEESLQQVEFILMTPFLPDVGAALAYLGSAERPLLDADLQRSYANDVISLQNCSSLSS